MTDHAFDHEPSAGRDARRSDVVPRPRITDATPQEAVECFRSALARGDASLVSELLAERPRAPRERDTLVDLIAGLGAHQAVQRLQPAWRDALASVEATRVGDGWAEVYERVSFARRGMVLHLVTTLERRAGRWRIVRSGDAPDAPWRVLIPFAEAPSVRRVLREAGLSCLEGSPDAQGTVHVVSADESVHAIVQAVASTSTPSTAQQALALSSELSSDLPRRWLQLRRLTTMLSRIARRCDASVHVPFTGHTVSRDRLRCSQTDPLQLARVWLRVQVLGDRMTTRGMGQLGFPEIELACPPGTAARKLLLATAVRALGGALDLSPDTEITVEGRQCRLAEGAQGPGRRATYGRYGAVRLTVPEGAT